jgi:uncharacterized membrane protein YfcA
MSGVGGSSLLAPLLILLFGFKALTTVGTDLMYSVPTKLLAAYLHGKSRTIDRTIVTVLLLGGIPGALLGLFALVQLQAHIPPQALNAVLRRAIGIAILLACAGSAILYLVRGRARAETTSGPPSTAVRWQLGAIGLVVGFMVSMTSVGSGSVTLPLLILVLPGIALRRLIGSEIAFAALLIPISAAGHATLGDVNWPACLALLVGSLPGVALGTRLCVLVDERWLQPAIVVVLAFAASRLI